MLAPRKGLPPRGMIYTGGGDFRETGERFVSYFKEHGGLQPTDHVMDIGSGIGRMAIPLSKYLDDDAQYYGFDLVPTGVEWCQKNISKQHPNFEFLHIDLENDLYTSAADKADEFVFPYGNESVDFVFLISVFTHMIPSEMSHYLDEIHRCLRPGGRCFFSCFTYDEVDRLSANAKFSFPYTYDHYALMNDKVVSANVAFERQYLSACFDRSGLTLVSEHRGSWAGGNPDSLDFQDIIVLRKEV